MLTTKRKPASVGEILIEEFMAPMGLTQGALAKAMGVQRKHVNELCNGRRNVTAATALILAGVFGYFGGGHLVHRQLLIAFADQIRDGRNLVAQMFVRKTLHVMTSLAGVQ